jgi:N-acetylglutamate synthase-like GNAT family acetyltransferase
MLVDTNSNIKIRKAYKSDIPQMCDLLTELFSIEADFIADPDKQARGLQLLLEDESSSLVLVAAVENEVVGMCSVQTLISTSEGGLVGLVEDVVVKTDYRSKGVGTALLSEIFSWCKEKGITRVQLLADRDNQQALDYYVSRKWIYTNLICMRRFTHLKETSQPHQE